MLLCLRAVVLFVQLATYRSHCHLHHLASPSPSHLPLPPPAPSAGCHTDSDADADADADAAAVSALVLSIAFLAAGPVVIRVVALCPDPPFPGQWHWKTLSTAAGEREGHRYGRARRRVLLYNAATRQLPTSIYSHVLHDSIPTSLLGAL